MVRVIFNCPGCNVTIELPFILPARLRPRRCARCSADLTAVFEQMGKTTDDTERKS